MAHDASMTDYLGARAAFYAAVSRVSELARGMSKGSACERRRRSGVRVKVGDASEFESVVRFVERLRRLGLERDEEIVCIDVHDCDSSGEDGDGGSFSCSGLTQFWSRFGNDAPRVRYTSAHVLDVVDERPVAIMMSPRHAPMSIDGYFRVVMDGPEVCLFVRDDVEGGS